MKKILGTAIAAFLILAIVGGGTWAYFSDPETSTGNILSAGTLDLKTDDVDGVTATLLLQNMKEGDTTGAQTIVLKNAGSINAATLSIDAGYVESDTGAEPTDTDLDTNLTADQFAALLTVNTMTYNSIDLLTGNGITDANTNGRIDMQDVAGATITNQAGINGGGATKDFVINVTLYDPGALSNDPQNDGIDITITFTLTQ